MIIDTDLVERGLMDTRFTVLDLSRGTGLSRQAIYNIRNGKTDPKKIELQSAIAIQKFLNHKEYQ